MSSCVYCGREREGNPGDMYHESACKSRDLEARIREARSLGVPRSQIQKLEDELERARYVGD